MGWDVSWNHWEPDPDQAVVDIPVVLGGAYACNKTYGNYLNGLKGLEIYGLNEQYLRMKTWLEGNTCKLLNTRKLDHLCRTQFPYPIQEWHLTYFIRKTQVLKRII